jgi:hypothetical protein
MRSEIDETVFPMPTLLFMPNEKITSLAGAFYCWKLEKCHRISKPIDMPADESREVYSQSTL